MVYKFRKYENDINFNLNITFKHGLGDCAQFVTLLDLYRRRGYNIAVVYDRDKQALFDLAGFPYANQGVNHPWLYYAGFNEPRPVEEAYSNKVGMLLNKWPLPIAGIGWEEICANHKPFNTTIDKKYIERTKRLLDHLPRPIILVHTQGVSTTNMKELPAKTVQCLYEKLLELGSVVELDWTGRAIKFANANFRNLHRDWGVLPLPYLFALLTLADVIIGIDSGPIHVARFFPIRKIFLGVHHYFGSVALPAPEQLCLAKHVERKPNVSRRRLWNVYEYTNDEPTVEDILAQCKECCDPVIQNWLVMQCCNRWCSIFVMDFM